MGKITVRKFVHVPADTPPENPDFTFFNCDMKDYGYVLINEQDITIEVPDDFNPVPAAIAALRSKQQKIRAEAEQKSLLIDEQIQKLLAIEAPKEVE